MRFSFSSVIEPCTGWTAFNQPSSNNSHSGILVELDTELVEVVECRIWSGRPHDDGRVVRQMTKNASLLRSAGSARTARQEYKERDNRRDQDSEDN